MGVQVEIGKVILTPSGNLVTHGGSGSGYSNYGCRCEECCVANSKRKRELDLERQKAADGMPSEVVHGLQGYVRWKCRCKVCKAAKARSRKANKVKKEAAQRAELAARATDPRGPSVRHSQDSERVRKIASKIAGRHIVNGVEVVIPRGLAEYLAALMVKADL